MAAEARLAKVKEELKSFERLIALQKQNYDAQVKTAKEHIDELIGDYKSQKLEQADREIEEDKNNKIVAAAQIIAEKTREIDELETTLSDYKLRQEAITEAIHRAKRMEEKANFYKVEIPPQNQEDIFKLWEVNKTLNNKEAIPRVIWDVYIQKPMAELIKRVTEGKTTGGIYKITYLPTGESYIGRTTDFKKRWTEHAKSSLGIGTIAHQTIHTRMAKDGIWNYSWEIIEVVEKEKQSEREKYYINFYNTKSQFNSNIGG